MDQQKDQREVLGLVVIVFAVLCSVLANTFVKLLSAVPICQLMQLRFLLQWCCSLSLSLVFKSRGHAINVTGVSGYRWLLAARAITYTSAIGAMWCALRFLPVGQATAIVYLHPIVCGILARQFLGETLGKVFWMQAVFSLLGVCLIANIQDTFGGESSSSIDSVDLRGVALAIFACFCFAFGNCLVRFLPASHPLEVQVYTDSLIGLVVMPVLLLASGSVHDWTSWNIERIVLLACFTAFGLATSFLAINGFKMAPATKAALFMYVEVPSAFAMQVLFFGEAPTGQTLLGAACITLAAIARLLYEVFVVGHMPAESTVSSVNSRRDTDIKIPTSRWASELLMVAPTNSLMHEAPPELLLESPLESPLLSIASSPALFGRRSTLLTRSPMVRVQSDRSPTRRAKGVWDVTNDPKGFGVTSTIGPPQETLPSQNVA